MAQTFFPINPVEVTPDTANDWIDVNLSAYLPEGSTGALFHIMNNRTMLNYRYDIGIRKKGSTDDRHGKIVSRTHCWCTMGVDDDRHCEIYIGHITYIDVYLVGYTKSGVTFFTNAYLKNPDVNNTWRTVDCSGEAPNAIGLIFELVAGNGGGSDYSMGLRMPGSSDNYFFPPGDEHNCFGAIIGCDFNQKVELRRGEYTNFYLVGYITDGAGFYDNVVEITPGPEEEWVDLEPLPSGAYMGFFQITSLAFVHYYGLRKKTSAENIIHGCRCLTFAFVECNANGIIQGYKDSMSGYPHWYLVGVADTLPFPSQTMAYWM